ncbi:hypothetical protein [Microbacterium aerolatum]|nr:hypothetical protein [Microbacterium aerolatum]
MDAPSPGYPAHEPPRVIAQDKAALIGEHGPGDLANHLPSRRIAQQAV